MDVRRNCDHIKSNKSELLCLCFLVVMCMHIAFIINAYHKRMWWRWLNKCHFWFVLSKGNANMIYYFDGKKGGKSSHKHPTSIWRKIPLSDSTKLASCVHNWGSRVPSRTCLISHERLKGEMASGAFLFGSPGWSPGGTQRWQQPTRQGREPP